MTCNEKWIFTITGDGHLSGWTSKKLQSTSQSQTCTKKRSWSLFGGLLPVWSTTTFWIPRKLLHLRSMLSKLMKCTKIGNSCIQHWSIGGPDSSSWQYTSHNQCFKNWMNWAMKLCLINHIQHLTSYQQTASSSSISTTFCKENASTTSRRQKMLPKNSANPKAWIFMPQE